MIIVIFLKTFFYSIDGFVPLRIKSTAPPTNNSESLFYKKFILLLNTLKLSPFLCFVSFNHSQLATKNKSGMQNCIFKEYLYHIFNEALLLLNALPNQETIELA